MWLQTQLWQSMTRDGKDQDSECVRKDCTSTYAMSVLYSSPIQVHLSSCFENGWIQCILSIWHLWFFGMKLKGANDWVFTSPKHWRVIVGAPLPSQACLWPGFGLHFGSPRPERGWGLWVWSLCVPWFTSLFGYNDVYSSIYSTSTIPNLYIWVGLIIAMLGWCVSALQVPIKIVEPQTSLLIVAMLPQFRSGRERGLHERALKQGVALPCPISKRMIPMKKSVDDPSLDMVSWPFLLPHDFATCLNYSTQYMCGSAFLFHYFIEYLKPDSHT